MLFKIYAENSVGDKRIFTYDNETNTLMDDKGVVFNQQKKDYTKSFPFIEFSKDKPLKKSKTVRRLKIQMGLSCNYSCDYCSQKFVERPPETSKKDIDLFMEKLNAFNVTEQKGLHVEFWGGEPLVYWKTLKPLAEAIREKFSHWKNPPKFSIITNGSLLRPEVCAWLMYMDFSVSISHDGPGQFVRGPDPFEDPEQRKNILYFYNLMKQRGKISFNSILSRNNISRNRIRDWFVDFTGDQNVILGEGGIVDSYDEDGISNSLTTFNEHFKFRQLSFNDILENGGTSCYSTIQQKINDFKNSVLTQKPSSILRQKCGMDDPEVFAIDMKGNVITCQNVSAAEVSKNGENHLGGNISDIEGVAFKSATHWSLRENCKNCPVLHICKGSCMFLDGKYWETSCDNAYSDNIPLFAAAFRDMTGYIPTYIDSENLPNDRKDIWGTILEHVEKKPKKVFPIKVVTDKIKLGDIDVYSKAKLQGE